MSQRRAKMLRTVSLEQNIDIKVLKRWYKNAPTPKKLQFIRVRGQLITLSNSYIDQLRLGIFPTKELL